MRVRSATMEDVAAIVALAATLGEAPRWGREVYEAALQDPQDAAGREESLQRCLLVAFAGDRLAGFAMGSCLGDEAELESIAVAPGERRTGMGKELCGSLAAWAMSQGAHAMLLEVRAGSAGARAFYRKLGYAEEGVRPRYYHDPTDDAVLMRLHLPAVG